MGWVLLGTPPDPIRLLYAAIGFSLLWTLLISFVAIARESDRDRGAHLAIAGSSGLVGIPGLVVAVSKHSSGAALVAVPIGVMAVALVYAAATRARPGSWGRQVTCGLAFLGLGTALAYGIAAAFASSGAEPPAFDQQRAAATYDIDATVVNRSLPKCGSQPASVGVLLDRGARPRLSEGGEGVWFDADVDGLRQIHHLEIASGRVNCWTCGEAGNNLRPTPMRGGGAIVFETDRYTSLWEPFNTELHAIRGAASLPEIPSGRLTRNSVPDDHAIAGAEQNRIAWSRLVDGRYSVMTARLRNTASGPALGAVESLESGGSAWLAPVAWSPTARALVIATGNPFRPLAAHSIDFAAGTVSPMAGGLAAPGAVAFSADGGWLLTARTEGYWVNAPFGWFPAELGFAMAAHATRRERRGPLLAVGSPTVRLSGVGSLGVDLSLGEEGRWGAVTGLAASAEGTEFVLGQQRVSGNGLEERLLRVVLDCPQPPVALPQG